MRLLKSIAFSYDPSEDRILAAVNAGLPEAWACWLTRRLTLAALHEARKFLDSTSTVALRAAGEFRQEIIAIERAAAIENTVKALRKASATILQASATRADRAASVKVTIRGAGFQLELHGRDGEVAGCLIDRDHLQRILQMLDEEVKKASWMRPPEAPAQSAAAPPDPARRIVRH